MPSGAQQLEYWVIEASLYSLILSLPSLSEAREVRGGGEGWEVYSSECLVGGVRLGSPDPDPISDQISFFRYLYL